MSADMLKLSMRGIKIIYNPDNSLFKNGVSKITSTSDDPADIKSFVRNVGTRMRQLNRHPYWSTMFRLISVPQARDTTGEIVIEWITDLEITSTLLGSLLDVIIGHNPRGIRPNDKFFYLDNFGNILQGVFEYNEELITQRALGNMFRTEKDAEYASKEFKNMMRRVTRNLYMSKRVTTGGEE